MANRDPEFDAYVLKIFEVLDRLDYYRLLGIPHDAKVPQIKKAFFGIATKFHPDRNRDAEEQVKGAIYAIFKRLNEAYRILCDHEKRKLYDRDLTQGKTRLEQDGRRKVAPKTPEDTMKSREARQFFRKAVEALEGGNILQAELHGKVAASREGNNEFIAELLEKIKETKQAKKKR